MKYNPCQTFKISLVATLWLSVSLANLHAAETAPPAVVYEKASTWLETVSVNRQALHDYKKSFVFSSDAVTAKDKAIGINVDLRGAQTLWLVSNHRGQAVWCSPQLERADGTTVDLTSLDPILQKADKGKLTSATAVVAGQNYPGSVFSPASSKIGYKLNGQYTRLIAKAGLHKGGSRDRASFLVCTAPVFETPTQSAHKLFARMDTDFPEYDRILLANGIEDERDKLLSAANPLAVIQKIGANALGQLGTYGTAFRDQTEGLTWLGQVLALQIKLYEVRDEIKQVAPILGRLSHEFGLQLSLLRGQADDLTNQMDSRDLGTSQPLVDIKQMVGKLARIESRRMGDEALPTGTLKQLADQATALAERVDHLLGWPTVRRNNQRSSLSHEPVSLPLQTHWVHTPDHAPQPAWPPPAKYNRAVNSPPLDPTLTYDRAFHTVVRDGLVYYGSSADDSVHCLDLTTGQTVWTYTTNGPIRLAPALYAGKCYVGSDDGHVYCLDGKTGSLVWSFRAGPQGPWIAGNGRIMSSFPVRCGICVSDNTVYFAAGLFPRQGTFLCAVNAETGAKKFVESLSCSPQGYMLLTPTHIMVPTGRTPFVMCDRNTGKQVRKLGTSSSWGQDLKGGSFALVIEDRIATGPSEDGHIHLFNAKRNETVIRSDGQQMLVSGPMAYILSKNSLFALDRRTYLLEKKESLKWRVPCEQSYCMIMAGNTIFCGTEGGAYAIDASTGARLWTTAVEGRVEGLVASGGRLLVNTSTGKLYCFSGAAPAPADSVTPATPMAVDAATAQRAADLVARAKVNKGYVLLQNFRDAALAVQLAKISDFRIVCAETDKAVVDRMRAQLVMAGLYGSRVVCHHWPKGSAPYQRYLFNVIAHNTGDTKSLSESIQRALQKQLRPHGGVLAIFYDTRDQLQILRSPEWLPGTGYLYQYRGALPGEGTWTHPYADPGNSACSYDQFSFANSTIQWFGAPGPRDIVDRHQQGPPPVYARGRVFVTGSDYIAAVDAYNGTILWENRLAESGRVETMNNCGNMVAVDDRLYVAHGEFCTAFDGQTGQQIFQTSTGQPSTEWGYLAHVNGVLLGSSGKSGSIDRPLMRFEEAKQQRGGVSCSHEFFACDLKTGKRLWRYCAQSGAVINPAIACSGNRLCFLESLNPATLKTRFGRTGLSTLLDKGARLVSLDITTGEQQWETVPNLENVKRIVYLSATTDTVIVTGSCLKDTEKGVKNRYAMVAHDATNGRERWTSLEVPGYDHATDGNHGAWIQHPAIVGDIIYGNGYARTISTGKAYTGWQWTKSHKCATLSASAYCAFSRYEQAKLPFMFDLKTGTRQALTTVSRPGCWINTLPVGGLVVIPEASAGCTCGYSIQTSLAMSLEPTASN